MERDQISDIRPPKNSNISYQTPLKNQISDITPRKNQISDITPRKNQISDITVWYNGDFGMTKLAYIVIF